MTTPPIETTQAAPPDLAKISIDKFFEIDLRVAEIRAAERVEKSKKLIKLTVFDGEKWSAIEGAPAKGRTLAVRSVNGSQFVFVAGAGGVKAGRVDVDFKWQESVAPDAQYAAVLATAYGERGWNGVVSDCGGGAVPNISDEDAW